MKKQAKQAVRRPVDWKRVAARMDKEARGDGKCFGLFQIVAEIQLIYTRALQRAAKQRRGK